MEPNEITFITYLDVIVGSCRKRNAIIKHWRQSGNIDYALKRGYLEPKQLEELKRKAKELEIK